MGKRKSKVAKVHYVDNAVFLEAMIEYKKQYHISKSNDEELPIISEYLGSVFLKIAQRLSFRPNFINYAFKDDMISDGIENCLHYIHNFNPEKSTNPFAYFTQIIYYAFIRRIQKEKKQTLVKQKLIQNAGVENIMDQLEGDDSQYRSQLLDFLQRNQKIEEPEKKKKKKK